MTTPYRLRGEPARDLAPVEPRELGRLRSVHPTGQAVRGTLIAGGSIAAVLCVMAVAWPGAIGFVVMACLFAAVVAAWVTISLVLGHDLRVRVHDNGLVIRRSARAPVTVAYDEIRGLTIERESKWVLELQSGRRIAIPMQLADRHHFESVIERFIERPVLADALRALASGQHLTFGPITLELDGVRHRGELFAWSDIDHVNVDDEAFVFVHKGSHHAIAVLPTSTVTFPRVLAALLIRRTDVVVGDPYWTKFV